jgi:hypothetical protein
MGGVYVEIKSASRPVRIDRVMAQGMTVPVCLSPCRQVLPRDGVYIITGDGVRSTSPFVLPIDRDQLVLEVTPGLSATAAVGIGATGGGLLSLFVGFGMALKDVVSWDGNAADPDKSPTKAELMMMGGLVVALFGVGLILASKTRVTSSTGAQFTETPPPKPSRFALTARGLEF